MSPFEKHHIPWNTCELGSEIEERGYIRVKISNHPKNRTRWRLKHHIIYEKYHPNIKIGKTDRVIFLDGNKRNFDINNLKLVSISEQAYIANLSKSKYKYNGDEKLELIELIKANLKIKKIENLIQEKYSGK